LATHPPDVQLVMACDECLAGRVVDSLIYMRNGNASAGIWGDSLIVRTGPGAYDAALEEPHVREFDITGRPMKGWVVVGPEGIDDDSALREWLRCAMDFANSLPQKP